MKILVASTNPGKLREIQAIMADLPVQFLLPSSVGLHITVAETGATYTENAGLKAVAYASASGLPALADDSGLEVEALDGAPGLFSARFSPLPGANDADRRVHLLSELKRTGKPSPWPARFYCAAVLRLPDGGVLQSEGDCKGEVIPEERGSNGFGYDPLFFLPRFGLTMAELSEKVKNQISHRAQAMREMAELMQLRRLF